MLLVAILLAVILAGPRRAVTMLEALRKRTLAWTSTSRVSSLAARAAEAGERGAD